MFLKADIITLEPKKKSQRAQSCDEHIYFKDYTDIQHMNVANQLQWNGTGLFFVLLMHAAFDP